MGRVWTWDSGYSLLTFDKAQNTFRGVTSLRLSENKNKQSAHSVSDTENHILNCLLRFKTLGLDSSGMHTFNTETAH